MFKEKNKSQSSDKNIPIDNSGTVIWTDRITEITITTGHI